MCTNSVDKGLMYVYKVREKCDINDVNIEFNNAIYEIECIINAGSSTRLICGWPELWIDTKYSSS